MLSVLPQENRRGNVPTVRTCGQHIFLYVLLNGFDLGVESLLVALATRGEAWDFECRKLPPRNPSQEEFGVAEIVADQFAKILAAADVKRVSGIVGDNPNGSSDAIRRQGKIEGIFVFPLMLLHRDQLQRLSRQSPANSRPLLKQTTKECLNDTLYPALDWRRRQLAFRRRCNGPFQGRTR
jgi:hypothetical protein